jgi:hypothetical protein
MQTSVSSESLTSLTGQHGVGAAPSPQLDTSQPHTEHTIEKRSKSDFTSDHVLHEGSKPIPFKAPRRPHEMVDDYGAYGRHLVEEANQADAVLLFRLNRRAPLEFSDLHEEEELPELLDFSIDIENLLGSCDSLQQERPKGRVLKWEVPAHRKAMPPGNLVTSSNSTGPAKVIEFRRPGQKPTISEKQIF